MSDLADFLEYALRRNLDEPDVVDKAIPLKPCPFCGDLDGLKVIKEGEYTYKVDCFVCLSMGPCCTAYSSARKAWNKRQRRDL